MANIAEIGFVAHTEQLATAETRLDALVPAAQRASKAATTAAAGIDKMAVAAGNAATATDRATKTTLDYASGMATEATRVGRAATANDNLAASLNRVSAAQDRVNRITGVSGLSGKSAKESAAVFEHAAALDALRAKYNPVFSIITRYKAEINEIKNANKIGALSVDEMTAAIQRQRQAALASLAAMRNNGAVVTAYGRQAGNTSFNTANLAAQFQDVAVTAAMGMNPLQIALQQGTQMALIFGQGGATNALTVFKQAILSVLSPLSFMVIAITGISAALLQMVNWSNLAKSILNGLASIIPTIAHEVTLLGAAFALAFAPTILTAIGAIATALATNLVRAIMLVISTFGIVPTLFVTAVAAISAFRDDLTNLLGFDLVKVLESAGNYIIQGLAQTASAIVFLFKNIPNIVGAAAVGSINAAIGVINSLIQKAVDGINLLIQGANKLKAFLPDGFNAPMEPFSYQGIGKLQNSFTTSLSSAFNNFKKQQEELSSFDFVGKMVSEISEGADWISGKLTGLANSIGSDSDKITKKFKSIVDGAQNQINSLKAEYNAIGLSEFESAKLRHETELFNQVRERSLTLTTAQTKELKNLAYEMATLDVAIARQRELFDFAKDATRGFIQDLRQGLEEGKNFWESFGDAAMNVLDKITDKLLNDVVNALFEVNSAASNPGKGVGSGLLSMFSGLFGYPGDVASQSWNSATSISGLGFAKGGAFTNGIYSQPTPFAFASGGAFGVMGEAGPEAVMPLARGPDGSLGVTALNDNTPNVYVDIEINGAPNATVREESGVTPSGDQFRKFIIDTNREAIANGQYDDVNSARYNNRPTRVIR